jgi:hypothetical protein
MWRKVILLGSLMESELIRAREGRRVKSKRRQGKSPRWWMCHYRMEDM